MPERNRMTVEAEAKTKFPPMNGNKMWPSERMAQLYEDDMKAAAERGEAVSPKRMMQIMGAVLDEFCDVNQMAGLEDPKKKR